MEPVPTAGGDRLLKRSAWAERYSRGPRPLARGWSHLLAAIVALPAALWWVLAVEPGRARIGVAGFALGAAAMFTASALLHLRRWSDRVCQRLLQVDHSGIYLAIGGTGLAIGTLGLQGWPSDVLVILSVVGAALGILLEWLPFVPPRGYSNTIYLTLGWAPVVLLPWLWAASGGRTVALLMVGGVLYTVGAIIVALRRPDPLPRVFGYHEVFHLLVIGAVIVHAVMIADLVTRHA